MQKNIVEYLGSNGWGTGTLYIYTGLKAGNVNSLFQKHPELRTDDSTLSGLLRQMLEALDYLAFRNLLHRDVKPDNILYTPMTAGEYLFQLADFGFANQHNLAKTHCGSPLFMAPEMYFSKGPQTAKMDVWSLFVTLISVTRTAGFHEGIDSYSRVLDLIRTVATVHQNLSPMAHEDPTLRASASQMRLKHFHGDGLTTPRDRIMPISSSKDQASRPCTRRNQEISQKSKIPRKTDSTRKKVQHLGVKKLRIRNDEVRVPGAFPRFS